MRIPKGWNVLSATDHEATVGGEHDAPKDAGTVRLHLLTRTVGKSDPQTFAAVAWQDAEGEDRFCELSEDDLAESFPPETIRLDLDGGACEVWSFGPATGPKGRISA
ncbi:hypothetical protein EON81_29740 [bacterium]|nr:MAG: hypothetical protein EON81_29740 [bacterium]